MAAMMPIPISKSCEGYLGVWSYRVKMTARGEFGSQGAPTISELKKFPSRTQTMANGMAKATRSTVTRMGVCRHILSYARQTRTSPNAAPWLASPPFQKNRISTGSVMYRSKS